MSDYHKKPYWDINELPNTLSYNIGYSWNPYPTWGTFNNLNMSMQPNTYTWFWDLTANGNRYCFEGRYCWSCWEPKWPGYEPTIWPVNDPDINQNSRGRLMVWENSNTQFGVSVVSNNKTVVTLNTGNNAVYNHDFSGFSRTPFTGMNI